MRDVKFKVTTKKPDYLQIYREVETSHSTSTETILLLSLPNLEQIRISKYFTDFSIH